MWDPTITLISAAIASLNPIASRWAVFCLSVLSWSSALVVISDATTQSIVLAAAALAVDYFLTSLFFIATLDL